LIDPIQIQLKRKFTVNCEEFPWLTFTVIADSTSDAKRLLDGFFAAVRRRPVEHDTAKIEDRAGTEGSDGT
jgi:hypothetical protein